MFTNTVHDQAVTAKVFKEGMKIEARHVKKKQLSEYLPLSALNQRKKSSMVASEGKKEATAESSNAGGRDVGIGSEQYEFRGQGSREENSDNTPTDADNEVKANSAASKRPGSPVKSENASKKQRIDIDEEKAVEEEDVSSVTPSVNGRGSGAKSTSPLVDNNNVPLNIDFHKATAESSSPDGRVLEIGGMQSETDKPQESRTAVKRLISLVDETKMFQNQLSTTKETFV